MENKNKHDNAADDITNGDPTSVNDVETNEAADAAGEGDDETTALEKEIGLQKDKYLRLVAEFDNFKRRSAKERMEMIQTAGKDVILSMLDVLDDCDRAEKQMTTGDTEQIKEGVQLVFNKLRNTLQSKGLKPMESIDTEFDVHKHEAIAEVPGGESKKGKVIDEIVKGYYLNDKLIRFAKVIVGK